MKLGKKQSANGKSYLTVVEECMKLINGAKEADDALEMARQGYDLLNALFAMEDDEGVSRETKIAVRKQVRYFYLSMLRWNNVFRIAKGNKELFYARTHIELTRKHRPFDKRGKKKEVLSNEEMSFRDLASKGIINPLNQTAKEIIDICESNQLPLSQTSVYKYLKKIRKPSAKSAK